MEKERIYKRKNKISILMKYNAYFYDVRGVFCSLKNANNNNIKNSYSKKRQMFAYGGAIMMDAKEEFTFIISCEMKLHMN